MKVEGKVVMILGGGGREMALAKAIVSSSQVRSVLMLPGNGGTTKEFSKSSKIQNISGPNGTDADSENVDLENVNFVVECAQSWKVDLVIPGPEAPLVKGVADALEEVGILCFGPKEAAARLEGSKAYFKQFASRNGLPTAEYKTFTDYNEAAEYVNSVDFDVVVKASGLAAGKGVIIPEPGSKASAESALRRVLVDEEFGEAGQECVVERFLQGDEVSAIGFCDGSQCFLLPCVQDHKRAYEQDQGPNTGGMGAICPAAIARPGSAVDSKIQKVMNDTVTALASEGTPYVGFLFGGFMVMPSGEPILLEFNCRLGDPEAQVLLPLLDCDLYEMMVACLENRAESSLLRVRSNVSAATVVLAAKGYPGKYEKNIGLENADLKKIERDRKVTIYHAGTKLGPDGNLQTSGGRVLAVTSIASSLKTALQNANQACTDIQDAVGQDQLFFRSDIGRKAVRAHASQQMMNDIAQPVKGMSSILVSVFTDLGATFIIAFMSIVVMIQASLICEGKSFAFGTRPPPGAGDSPIPNIPGIPGIDDFGGTGGGGSICRDEIAYAVSAGVIGFILAAVVEFLDVKKMNDYRFYASALLGLWWILGGLVLTFLGPFAIASNAWAACWINIIASLVLINKFVYPISTIAAQGLDAAGPATLLLILSSFVVFFAGLSVCVNVCTDINGFSIAAGIVSLVLQGPILYLTREKSDLTFENKQKLGRYGYGFLLLWWLCATGALTFAGPINFVSFGNGFIACWTAVAASIASFQVYSPDGIKHAMESFKKSVNSMRERVNSNNPEGAKGKTEGSKANLTNTAESPQEAGEESGDPVDV